MVQFSVTNFYFVKPGLIPREARLINLSGGAECPSGAKPRQFERKRYIYIYIYIVEDVRNVA